MGQRLQCARYLYVNSERLTRKPALDQVVLRRGVGFNRNNALLTHDSSWLRPEDGTTNPQSY